MGTEAFQDTLDMIEQVGSYEEYQYLSGLQERKIFFNDEVTLSVVNRIVYNIMKWDEEDNKNNIPIEERQPIKLHITTNGGCVISGLAILNAMKAAKTPTWTIGIAICASMGAYLLMSGDMRFCHEDTTVLIHDGSLAVQSTSKKAKQQMKYYDALDEKIRNLTLSKTKITQELYEEKEDEEWFLFGSEALELGIVDKLL